MSRAREKNLRIFFFRICRLAIDLSSFKYARSITLSKISNEVFLRGSGSV